MLAAADEPVEVHTGSDSLSGITSSIPNHAMTTGIQVTIYQRSYQLPQGIIHAHTDTTR